MSDQKTNSHTATPRRRGPMIGGVIIGGLVLIVIVYWLSFDTAMVDNSQGSNMQIEGRDKPTGGVSTTAPSVPEPSTNN